MVSQLTHWFGTFACAAAVFGCKPEQEGRPSLLNQPRILAIQAFPAESAPNDSVQFNVLRASADGPVESEPLDLAFCVARKPLAEPGVIASACLDTSADAPIVVIPRVQPTFASIPNDACSMFGPSQPIATPGQPPLRPVDPDTTGGYYQPLRAIDDGAVSVGFVRILCGLAGTTQDNNIAWKKRYVANTNPSISRVLYARKDNVLATLENSELAQFRPGEVVRFAVTWPSCGVDEPRCGDGVCRLDEDAVKCPEDCSQPYACDGAETYTLLDPASNQLRLARETVRVSWYVTGGTLARDTSGRTSSELERDAQNQWIAPDSVGDHWLIAVIRDDRGGVGWTARQLRVVP
ncbi:MAG TPA: hypothetical protein VIV60_23470 [Polyangiaceae bacterium]